MSIRALLFTDVVDSVLLAVQMGEARAAQVWERHDRLARDLLAEHGGREIDRTDGFFLLFDDADSAARYSAAYHRALEGLDLRARAGLHVGTVSLRANRPDDVARGAKPVEVEGLAKPFAARIMALARGGQTLLSDAARQALSRALPEDMALASHGHYRLKGVEEPVELFELGDRRSAAFAPPPDAEKAYRVVRAGELWRPVREVRHNLPAERDAFVGRTGELRALAVQLEGGTRLLTVVGTGGTGKTRLVRRYGWTWLGDWPGGVAFCDLSEARSLEGICFAVAAALDVPLAKGDPVLQLGHAIAGRGRCLVVLDNFEQVLAQAPATLGHWLDRAAQAAFVVTSRERLHLPGEQVFAVEPLSLAHDAVDLFVARARAQRPGFALTDANRPAVAEVVRLLDGLPLAIELAAARARVLSPAQLVDRLRDRFGLLAGARGAAARQATLRAAIDWSWNLLAPWEQAALAQCSVFEGGFTLDAAEAVLDLGPWPGASSTLDAVQALVDKSLLRTWVPAAQGRYDIEEPYFGVFTSIREYAAQKLAAAGADAEGAAHERHGRHFARFGAEPALQSLSEHGGVRRRRALALELDNLVAACRRAVARADAATAVATFRAAWEVLELLGPFSLGVDLGTQVLSLAAADPLLRAAAQTTRARALHWVGRTEEALAQYAEALALSRELDDKPSERKVLMYQGHLHRDCGRMEAAKSDMEAARALQRATGDRIGEGIVLGNLGVLHVEQGRPAEAQSHWETALAIHREVGNRRSEGIVLGNLGGLLNDLGRFEEADAHHHAALAIHREVGNRRFEGFVLNNLGNLCYAQGRHDVAREHYEAAIAVHRDVGDRRSEGIALGNLGCVDFEQGRLDVARTCFEAALAIHREVGNRGFEGSVLGNIGNVHREQGRADDARACYEAALAIHHELGELRHRGIVLGKLGLLAGEGGETGAARESFRSGEALLREIDDRFELAMLLCDRARFEKAAGDGAAARSAFAEAESLAATMGTGPESGLGRKLSALRQSLAG